MKRLLLMAMVIFAVLTAAGVDAHTIYPINRAAILAGQRFDFKVEFDSVVNIENVRVTINGRDYADVFGKKAEFIAKEEGVKPEASAIILRNVEIKKTRTVYCVCR